jgi:hypothetical protein
MTRNDVKRPAETPKRVEAINMTMPIACALTGLKCDVYRRGVVDGVLQAGFVARTTKPATGAPASLRSSADSASAVSPDWVSTRFTYARLWL